MRTPRKTCFTLLATLFTLIPLISFESNNSNAQNLNTISVNAAVDKAQSTVGDTILYTVTITHSPETEILPLEVSSPDLGESDKQSSNDPDSEKRPPEADAFEGFDFIEKGLSGPRRVDDGIEQEFWYRLRADIVGQYTFPAFPVRFTTNDASGQKTPGQAVTPKVDIEILSVLNLRGEPTDIQGIKPLTRVNKDWLPYIIVIISILIILGLINWARKKWSKKDEDLISTSKQEIILSPDELALKNLKQLLSKDLIQKGNFREFYFELSDIFRRYLGSRYSFPAIDWTTEEISSWLRSCHQLDAGSKQKAQSILTDTDQVKFAKGETNADTCMVNVHSIEDFIYQTKQIKHTPSSSETDHKTETIAS
ncbi:MAG: hypothetical protein ACQ9MH_02000 [Nitrospinales bacterium]